MIAKRCYCFQDKTGMEWKSMRGDAGGCGDKRREGYLGLGLELRGLVRIGDGAIIRDIRD
jgi:hypothetical protein